MSHQLINQDSGNVEYYTDPKILAKMRELFRGTPDLDPASSQIANQHVQAKRYFTVEDDGLKQEWFGKVWMNHPFSKGEKLCKPNCKKKTCVDRGYHITSDLPGNVDWITKLVNDYENGGVEEALAICYASTSEGWFRPLHLYPQCYLTPRTNYYNQKGEKVPGVTKGSVITYLGTDVDRFCELFSEFGEIKLPYRPTPPSYVYIAGPYTHLDEDVMAYRAAELTAYAAKRMKEGAVVFSPITHGHNMAMTHSLPKETEYWRGAIEAMVPRAKAMEVLKLDGWDKSVGVALELDLCEQFGIPVTFVDQE